MSALTDYRTDRFKQRKLALVVTPSEYDAFVRYCEGLWEFNEPERFYKSYKPDLIEEGHACLFFRAVHGHLTWHDPNDINVPDDMPAARLPFALLETQAPATKAVVYGLNPDAVRLAAEIQMRLRSILNDVHFVNNAVEKLMELTGGDS